MRIEKIEVYSDAVNSAVMRHPGRRFPGVLVQGDTLHSFATRVEEALAVIEPETDAYYELLYVRDGLVRLRDHYKAVLNEHDIGLPFVE